MPIPQGWVRASVDLPGGLSELFRDAQQIDGVSRAARMLALAEIWSEDSKLAKRVSQRAIQNRARALREGGRS